MLYNNWNLYLQSCLIRSQTLKGDLLLMGGDVPDLSMGLTATDINLMIEDRRSEWIARYSVWTQVRYSIAGQQGYLTEERGDTISLGPVVPLYDTDVDQLDENLAASFQAAALKGSNPSLSQSTVVLPTWFVLVHSSYGPGVAPTLNSDYNHVKMIGTVSTPSNPQPQALLQLRRDPKVGRPPTSEDLGPLRLPF